jgi:predicted HD superfamily hydrolase involved in NAD metabolism
MADVARDLAEYYGVDVEKTYITGLLHDYAKGIPGDQLLAIAEENGLIEDEIERYIPDVLHAPVGAYLLKEELGIEDDAILNAVRFHTLGSLHMSEMDKIIYLADMIEPGRDFPGMERLKCLAFRNLDQGMLVGSQSTLKYCIDQGRIIHPKTVLIRNHFLMLLWG